MLSDCTLGITPPPPPPFFSPPPAAFMAVGAKPGNVLAPPAVIGLGRLQLNSLSDYAHALLHGSLVGS